MLHTPSAQSTATLTSTGQLVAIAICCQRRSSALVGLLDRPTPKI